MSHDPGDTFQANFYEATAHGRTGHGPPSGHLSCDVCVIGGGFAGVSTALHLADQGYDVCLVEANRIGYGASGRNGGQVFSGQRVGQDDLENSEGAEAARALWTLAEEARLLVLNLVTNHAIPCDLKGGALLAATKRSHAGYLKDYAAHLQDKYAYHEVRYIDGAQMPSYVTSHRYKGGLWDARALHLHPLNYLLGMARIAGQRGVRIFETAPVVTVENGPRVRVRTAGASIDCTFAVLACNAYLENLAPPLTGTFLPINSFVGVTEPLGKARAEGLIPSLGCVADTRTILDYYRLTADHRLLFGGGESYGLALPARNDMARRIRRRIDWVFPSLKDVELSHVWGGRIAITRKRMPHMGRLKPNIFFAQGFSGHGISIGTLAGKLISEAICGQSERFDVYARLKHRPFPGGTRLRHPLLVMAMLWARLKDLL